MYLARTNLTPKTRRKLEGFAHLPEGWHYGSGGPISQQVVDWTLELYETLLLNGFTKTDAFAGVDGEILLSGYFLGHYVGLEVHANGLVTGAYESDGEPVAEEEGMDLPAAKEWVVREVVRRIWNISASYILGTMIIPSSGSMTWHSRNLATAGCPSFFETVPNTLVA